MPPPTKLNDSSYNFSLTAHPLRRAAIALFAAFLFAFSGANVAIAAGPLTPGEYDGIDVEAGDYIESDYDIGGVLKYQFNSDTTISPQNGLHPVLVDTETTIDIKVKDDATLSLISGSPTSSVKMYDGVFNVTGGHLYINSGGVADTIYTLEGYLSASVNINNQSITLENTAAGIFADYLPSEYDGHNYLINTGAFTIRNAFNGLRIQGNGSPNTVEINADSVSITADQTISDNNQAAAIYSINYATSHSDTIKLSAQTLMNLYGKRYGVYQYGQCTLTMYSPYMTTTGGNDGFYINGANDVTLTGDEISIAGQGRYGIYMSGEDSSYGQGNSFNVISAKSFSLSGGTYALFSSGAAVGECNQSTFYAPVVVLNAGKYDGVYLDSATLDIRASESERASIITAEGGRYGIGAHNNASALLYADRIAITGGRHGVVADGSDGNGGSISLSAPVVTVSAGEGGSSIYTDENGSVTAGDKGALVQLTGCVKSGYSNDDGTMDKTSGGTAVLNLDAAGSFLEGQSYDVDWDSNARDVKGVTMNLGGGAYWSFSGESTMRCLNGSGGEVRMQNGTTGDTANIGSLSGKGSFLLDTDIDADTADSVFAKTGSDAEYGVLVENSGSAPNRERMNQYLVKTEDKGGTFSLLNRDGKVEAGIYSYSLASEEVRDGKEWYLMRSDLMPEPEPDPEPTPGTDPDEPGPAPDPGTEPDEPSPAPDAPITTDELSSTARAALGSIVSPFIWYIEVDSLYKRIDEYTPDYEGGAWFRAFGKKEYYDNGLVDGVTQEYGGMSAGYDWVKAYDDGAKLYYGFMLGYGEGEREISFGSNDFDSKHFSLYGIYKKRISSTLRVFSSTTATAAISTLRRAPTAASRAISTRTATARLFRSGASSASGTAGSGSRNYSSPSCA